MSHVDDQLNAAVYGAGVTPQQILTGEVAAPPEFAALTEALHQMAGEAQARASFPAGFWLPYAACIDQPPGCFGHA